MDLSFLSSSLIFSTFSRQSLQLDRISASSCRATTTIPSASPRMRSPGFMVTPPDVRDFEKMGNCRSVMDLESRTEPLMNTPATPFFYAARERISPYQLLNVSPRFSIAITLPGLAEAIASTPKCLLDFIFPAAVISLVTALPKILGVLKRDRMPMSTPRNPTLSMASTKLVVESFSKGFRYVLLEIFRLHSRLSSHP